MEKQLHLFSMEDPGSTVWLSLPELCRKKIESLLAELIIQYLTSITLEVANYEKK